MKKIFGLITIFSLLAIPVLATSPANHGNSLTHPLPATDVKIVKKAPFSVDVAEIKGKPPAPLGQDKNGKGPAATGILGATTTGAKYAIVIGICNYPGTRNDLCWSDGDSWNMYKALTTLYGYSPENVYLLRDMVGLNNEPYYDPEGVTDGPATAQEIEKAILAIEGKIQEGDEVVFFFSGHGADGIARDNDKETRDEGIVVHNGTNTVIIWDGQLRDRFSQIIGAKTTRIAFVFDSCLAGGMNDVADTGRVVSMATGETQVAYVFSKESPESGKPGEGVFSHYFVNEGMLQGKADRYDHLAGIPDVVVEEAFDYANEIIPSIWERQNPVISDNFTNDLLL